MALGDPGWPDRRHQPHDHEGLVDAGCYHLGIDPSLTKTGVAVLTAYRLDTYLLKPPEGVRGPARLAWYRDMFSRFTVSGHVLASVTIEGYAYSQANAAHPLGELGGVLRLLFWECGKTFYEASPGSIKKFAKGSGGGGKEGIPLGLLARWGFYVDQEDEADATVAALIGANKARRHESLTNPMREALDKVNAIRPPPPRTRTRTG